MGLVCALVLIRKEDSRNTKICRVSGYNFTRLCALLFVDFDGTLALLSFSLSRSDTTRHRMTSVLAFEPYMIGTFMLHVPGGFSLTT